MKSDGEAMATGRTFKESLQKCLRSLEIGRSGLGGDGNRVAVGRGAFWTAVASAARHRFGTHEASGLFEHIGPPESAVGAPSLPAYSK